MRAITAIADILKYEGVEYIFGIPASPIIDAATIAGIRPIIPRSEPTAISMADGYVRVSNGHKMGVCFSTIQASAQNLFPGIAQAFADSTPVLVFPLGSKHDRFDVLPNFDVVFNCRGIAKWVARINSAARVPDMMRRAFTLLRNGRGGPVILELPADVFGHWGGGEQIDEALFEYTPVKKVRSAGDPADVRKAVKALLAANNPVIHVGQGVLYAEATDELRQFAELLQAPVMTTIQGKSAFPEDHPLSIGTGAATATGMVRHFLQKTDFVFGIGCSFFKTWIATGIPPGKSFAQVTIDEFDINKDYPIAYPIIGDARLVLQQLIDEVKRQVGDKGRKENHEVAKEVKKVKDAWLSEWMPLLTSNEVPINPYRVIWDLMNAVDRTATIVTHDSGNPRDQMVPFFEAIIPRGYLGWGHSTHLGWGLGLAMGAKLADKDKLVVNVMGDYGFGFSGMDFETAVREKIPILTIVLNNSATAGYEKYFPIAVERYGSKYLSGNYTKVAEGLGGYSEKVEKPADIVPALQQAMKVVNSGTPALLEMITKEEYRFSECL